MDLIAFLVVNILALIGHHFRLMCNSMCKNKNRSRTAISSVRGAQKWLIEHATNEFHQGIHFSFEKFVSIEKLEVFKSKVLGKYELE